MEKYEEKKLRIEGGQFCVSKLTCILSGLKMLSIED